MKLFSLLKFLRFKSFDVSTPEGRSQERYRLALWSFLANIVSKAMAFAVIMLSVRWTLPYLGEERFGVWMTVASFAVMLTLLDLGIGNALINHSAHAAAEDNVEKLKKTISGSLGFLFLVAAGMGLLLGLFALLLPIEQIFKVKDAELIPEIRQTLLAFAMLFGLNLFSTGVQKLFSGLQRTFESLIATATCSSIALACVWWAAKANASIPLLLTATFGIQSLSGFLLIFVLIKRKLLIFNGIKISIAQQYKNLLKPGIQFFILQLGLFLNIGADSLIISSTLGAASVAIYSIAQKLFQICTMGMYMFNGPLWGAYADATARKDKTFIRATIARSIKLTSVLSILVLGFILIFHDTLLSVWLSNTVSIPFAFLAAFAAWTFVECLTQSITVFLHGVQIVKPQIVKVLLVIAISLPLKFWLIHKWGVIAIPLVNAGAFAFAIIFVYGFLNINLIKSHLK